MSGPAGAATRRDRRDAELNDAPQHITDRDRRDAGALNRIVGYHLRRASAVIAADFARTFADTGLRQVPFAVLATIADHPGTNQGAVGRALGIKRANMVALINELMEQGLVDRSASADRRAFALSLTEQGRATLADAVARIEAHERRLLARFTAAERDQLTALLARIVPAD